VGARVGKRASQVRESRRSTPKEMLAPESTTDLGTSEFTVSTDTIRVAGPERGRNPVIVLPAGTGLCSNYPESLRVQAEIQIARESGKPVW
jgi:hypothetical protein